MSFTISAAQADEIGWRHFRTRLARLIADADPDARAIIHTARGKAFIERACTDARGHGLTSELEMARYVVTAWLLGLNFGQRFPAMREILAASNVNPLKKSEAIEKLATTVLRQLAVGAR